jgi:hypothetical protein
MKKLSFFTCFFLMASSAMANTTDFAIIGDYGSSNQGEGAVASLISKYQPEFVITLGDNNYRTGCWETIDENIGQYYSNYIGNYKGKYGKGAAANKFYPSLGNHDWYAKESCLHHGNLPYLEYFTLPGNNRYYEFVEGPVHFFVLDSDPHEPDGIGKGSTQYTWFVEAVAHSKAPFKVVYFHHPPYSSGPHGDNKKMQWDFKALGVDLVLRGHDHNYERILQDGFTYIVNGIGGPKGLSSKKTKTKGSKFFYSKKYGFMLAHADEKAMSFKLINEDDEVIDNFTIIKDHGEFSNS